MVDCASKSDVAGTVSTVNTSQIRTAGTVIADSPGQALSWASKKTGKSLGGCIGGSGASSFVGVTASICYYATPCGDSGITVTGGLGPSIPGGVSGLAAFSVSNAQTLSDFGGPFTYFGGSAGSGLRGVGVQGQQGQNSCGRPIWVGSAGWAPTDPGAPPVNVEFGKSYTLTYSGW